MAISIGNGVFAPDAQKRVHGDRETYFDGAELLVFFRQTAGPPGLLLRLQLAVPRQVGMRATTRWVTFYAQGDYEDADQLQESALVRLDFQAIGAPPGARLRAVVYTEAPEPSERRYKLSVSRHGKT